jgi:hypothetical protein
MGRRPRVDRTPEQKRQIVQEGSTLCWRKGWGTRRSVVEPALTL